MAICGTRMESIVTVAPSGAKTGIIWWMNNGTSSLESKSDVTAASSVLGDALDGAGNRAVARKPAKAVADYT